MWADAQRDGRPAEYRWRPLLNATIRVPCSNADSMGQQRLGRKVNFAPGKIPLWGKSRQKCIYSVAAQETAKYCAKFGWLPLIDVAAVTKPRRETR